MRWLVVAVVLLAAGCGSESAAPADSDEERVRAVAQRYVTAVVNQDWAAACETRTEAAQREMAELTGECEGSFEMILGAEGAKELDGMKVGDVRVQGERAEVDIRHPTRDEATTLTATKDAGEWRLTD